MEQSGTIKVKEVFHFKDGRTVFVGLLEDGPTFIHRGRFGVWLNNELLGLIDIEGEMLNGRPRSDHGEHLRSVSTTDTVHLDREAIEGKTLVLKPALANQSRRFLMHRYLIGVEPPPSDYVPDPMTLGPVLPQDWDGDAWEKIGGGSFLRAWNAKTCSVAYGRAGTYEEARRILLRAVADGGNTVTLPTKACP